MTERVMRCPQTRFNAWYLGAPPTVHALMILTAFAVMIVISAIAWRELRHGRPILFIVIATSLAIAMIQGPTQVTAERDERCGYQTSP